MMTADAVFEASGGDHVNGERHEGQQAVRAAYAAEGFQVLDAELCAPGLTVRGDTPRARLLQG